MDWRELIITGDDGQEWGLLGAMVRDAPANLNNATIENGRITEWPQFMLAAPGEEPNWDTPRGTVDWDGFTTALAEVG